MTDWRTIPLTSDRYEMNREGDVRNTRTGKPVDIYNTSSKHNAISRLAIAPHRVYCATWHSGLGCDCWKVNPTGLLRERATNPRRYSASNLRTMRDSYLRRRGRSNG